MKWLWFAAPLILLFLYFVTSMWPSTEEKRLRAELERWLAERLGAPRLRGAGAQADETAEMRRGRLRRLPNAFQKLLLAVGGGSRLVDVTLVAKGAYLAARVADGVTASNSVTVLCRLAKRGPTFTARPLPMVDGRLVDNRGLVLSGEPNLAEHFIIENSIIESSASEGSASESSASAATNAKKINRWLEPSLREALLEFGPDCWLRVEGGLMALTAYGAVTADEIDDLVALADQFFELHGVDPDASLVGAVSEDLPETDAAAKPAATKAPAPWQRLASSAIDLSLYALGIIAVAAIVGRFEGFRPSVLFNSPDPVALEPWQGGWTTKGFGGLVAAESLLIGVISLQAYLAARWGQSVGKWLLGMKVVRVSGERVGFGRAVALRSWSLVLVPIAAALSMARPLTARAFFQQLPSLTNLAILGALLAVVIASAAFAAGGRGLNDRLADTMVVTVPRFRLASVQLGASGPDKLTSQRLARALALIALVVAVNAAAFYWDFFPIY